jgi:hypothetical protein
MPPAGGNFSAALPESECKIGFGSLPNPITVDCPKALQTTLSKAVDAENGFDNVVKPILKKLYRSF